MATFVWYVWYIFPQTAGLFEEMGVDLPYMTGKTLDFARWMEANYLWVFLLSFSLIGGFVTFARSQKGKYFLHENLIRIRVIGRLLRKLNIDILCRVLRLIL